MRAIIVKDFLDDQTDSFFGLIHRYHGKKKSDKVTGFHFHSFSSSGGVVYKVKCPKSTQPKCPLSEDSHGILLWAIKSNTDPVHVRKVIVVADPVTDLDEITGFH